MISLMGLIKLADCLKFRREISRSLYTCFLMFQVVTLTKHRGLGKPDDEQLHVLPLHVMDMTDEYGDREAQFYKVQTGALEVLQKYPMEARLRAEPFTPKAKLKKAKKGTTPPGKRGRRSKKPDQQCSTPPVNTPGSHLSEEDKALKNLYFSSEVTKNLDNDSYSQNKGSNSFAQDDSKSFVSYEDLMKFSHLPGFSNLHESFWNYYNTNGVFPPPQFLKIGQQKLCGHKNGFTVHDMEHTTGYSKMASEHSVISTDSSFAINNTQGQTNGAVYTGQGQVGKSDLDQRQHIDAPLDLSSSGSSCDLKAMFSSKTQAATYDQTTANAPCNGLLPHAGNCQLENGSLPQSFVNRNQMSNSPSIEHSVQNMKSTQEFMTNQSLVSEGFNNFVSNRVSMFEDSEENKPKVVKCEMEYNENAFHDPEIGGVAIALQHGAVLFEVAKRELHATTGLRNPSRYTPTRISLVFYQHKNLNHKHHGWYEYEKKCEILRQKRLEKAKKESDHSILPEIPLKNGEKPKKKRGKKDKIDFSKTSAAQYKYMWDAPVVTGDTLTTDSVITRWIDSQPMVTGPYQRWI